MRAGVLILWLTATMALQAASTGGLQLGQAGSLTSEKSEVITGTRSIKGSNNSANWTAYLSSSPDSLPFRRDRAYRVTFRYKVLTSGSFLVHFDSPTGRPRASDNAASSFNGTQGETGERTFVATLQSFDDYSLFFGISGRGAIAIDDIQITDVASGQVVASEDAEPGTALISTFFVSTNKASFVWGEAVKVTAAWYDENGRPRSAGPVTWTVDPAGAATLAADGTVTPRALRNFTVRATAGGRSGEVRLQVRPKRIVVIPEASAMIVGSTQKLRAEVLDLADRPIPGVAVEWGVGNQNTSPTPSASIDQTGLLKGLLRARVRPVARIRYTEVVPGFITQVQGDTLVEVKAPETYRFERIWAGKLSGATTSRLAPRPAQLVPTESGGFVFAASLDGLGGALLEWKDGEVKAVPGSGRVHVQSGLPLTDVAGYARNASGEMLVRELDATGQPVVSGGPAGEITPMYTNGTAVFGADSVSGFSINRNSLADSGAIAMLAGFDDSVTGKFGHGIFRGYGRRLSEAAVTTIEDRLDAADTPTGFAAYGIADDGTVWFVQCCNRPGTLWRSRPGLAPEKVLAAGTPLGDAIANSTLDNFTGAPTLFVAPNGDVVIAVSTNRGSRWVLWRNGDKAPSEFLNASPVSVFWYHPSVGALLDTTVSGRGRGLYLWDKEGARLLLALNDTSLDGSPVEELLSATSTSSGTIYAMVRTANSPMVIARLAPGREVLLKAGDSVPVTVPPVISALIPGARTGTPLVLAGGQTGSIARLEENGGISAIVRLGERLPDRKFYVGSKINQVRTLPDGRIVFGQDLFARESGIYTWSRGAVGLTLSAPLTDPAGGRMADYVASLEVNQKGDIALWSGYASSGIFRIRDGVVSRVGVDPFAVDGSVISGFSWTLSMDDTGQIAFLGSKPGTNGQQMVLWDGAESHVIFAGSAQTPDGRSFSYLGNPRGCGGSLVMGAAGSLLRYREGGWQYLVGREERLASGEEANLLDSSLMDVNHNCDVAFLAGFPGQGRHIGARFGQKYHELQNLDDLTPEGDLLRVVQVLMNDDGTVFVLGANDRGDEVVYRGTPMR